MPTIIIRSNNNPSKVLHTVEGESLWRANLSKLDLSGAALYAIEVRDHQKHSDPIVNLGCGSTTLSGANLTRANLSGAVFSGEVVVGANLSHANLSGAALVRTNLVNVNLRDANLAGARLMSTCFSNCTSLHLAKGLDQMEHFGPSALDVRTLRACVAHLPTDFLHGLGYTDQEIAALQRLYRQQQDFASCFISYARSDNKFAANLRKHLLKANISCWQDVHDMRGGSTWRDQIYKAIETHDKLILICSTASLTRPVVVEEILEAIERERETGTQKLFPIRIDDFVLSDELESVARREVANGQWRQNWVTYVRSYHIPDFSRWNNSKVFRSEFAKLLDALREPPKRKR